MDRGAWWATVSGVAKFNTAENTGHTAWGPGTSKVRTQMSVTPRSSVYPSTAHLLRAFLSKEAIWEGTVKEPLEPWAKLLVV